MIHLPKEKTKLLVAIHGWSGIVLGLLLYAVVLTGMTAVFAEEVGGWSAGHRETRSAFEKPIDASVRQLAARTPAEFRKDLDLFEVGDRNLGAFFHRHETTPSGEVVSRGVYYQLDRSGRIVSEQQGTGEQVFGPRNDDALSSFLVDTHVRLHVPNPWGLLLTGILGLVMLVAAVSGLLIHRHLFKDIFTLRRSASPVLANRDRHSVAGTWSLPFAFILAFTGSFFSFFGTVGVPIVAMAAFGGNQRAMSDAVFGAPGQPDPRPRAIGNLDRIAADAIQRAGSAPTFLSVEHFGRADAAVTSFHSPKAGDIEPLTFVYNGATAEFARQKPSIGSKPSAGGTLAAIMGPLHFGNFAGILSKAVWFGLGFAMCYVTLTGLQLWLARRAREARSLGWLERAVTVVGFGLPVALLGAAIAFLIAMPFGRAVFWTPAGFVATSLAAIVAGIFCAAKERLERGLKDAMTICFFVLPPTRLAVGGPGWSTAMASGQPGIVAMDLALFLGGGWLLWCRFASVKARAENGPILEPAQ